MHEYINITGDRFNNEYRVRVNGHDFEFRYTDNGTVRRIGVYEGEMHNPDYHVARALVMATVERQINA